MNNTAAIQYLANQESKHFTIYKDEKKVNKSLPYFQLCKQESDYLINCYNYIGHDNQDRMLFFKQYLQGYVLPLIDKNVNLSGFYNIELHDSYNYLSKSVSYDNCLTWCKTMNDPNHNPVLLPDLYQMTNYGGILNNVDDILWNQKKNKISFYGCTTGDRNPLHNERIQTCLWGLEHRSYTDLYITNIVQMKQTDVFSAIPKFQDIYHPPTSQTELFNYKFNLDIDGNVSSWSRVPVILNSKTLLFKMPSRNMCYYYPILQSGTHFVSVNKNNMRIQYDYYLNNPKEAAFIIQNANKFVKDFLQPQHAILYIKTLFESAFWNS